MSIIGLEVSQPLELALGPLKPCGVQFDRRIIDDHERRMASFSDPDGNSLYLAESSSEPCP
jgi:hypothetical protein